MPEFENLNPDNRTKHEKLLIDLTNAAEILLSRRQILKTTVSAATLAGLACLGLGLPGVKQQPTFAGCEYNGCSGCDGGCVSGCSDTCVSNCTGGCGGDCSSSCTSACSDNCDSGCSDSCEGTCSGTCSGGCNTTCTALCA